MYFHDYSKEEKEAIAKELKNYSLDVCIKDYHRLQDGFNAGLDTIAPLSLVGIKFIEHYIYPELLNTKIKQGFSFYDFWGNKDFYLTRDASTKKLIEYIKTEKPKLNEIKASTCFVQRLPPDYMKCSSQLAFLILRWGGEVGLSAHLLPK
jgi:hypothetical protein